jgi:hypothetical protein
MMDRVQTQGHADVVGDRPDQQMHHYFLFGKRRGEEKERIQDG